MSILVTKSSIPPFEEFIEEIAPLWDTRWITNMNVKHQELEQQLISFMEIENISLFTNGHLALESLLKALGLEGEVITTPFTFVSTTHAIVNAGLTPVFCDIDPLTYTIDVHSIESLITDKTCAILAVHVYGNVCDVEALEYIGKKYDIKILYDAAHAFGVSYKGKGIGSYGDASMFSFHATKVFNTIEGGAIATHDEHLKEILEKIKNFGINGPEDTVLVGINAKMNEFQASMGICNLRHIDEYITKRQRVVETYNSFLSSINGIKLQPDQKNVVSNYGYYPIVIDGFYKEREEIVKQLNEKDIFPRKYFYPLTSEMSCYKQKYSSGKTPVALSISEKILCLPLYPDLHYEEVEKICGIILES